jgi:hypothetical protein
MRESLRAYRLLPTAYRLLPTAYAELQNGIQKA